MSNGAKVIAIAFLSIVVGAGLTYGGNLGFSLGLGFLAGGFFLFFSVWRERIFKRLAQINKDKAIADITCVSFLFALALIMLWDIATGNRPNGYDHAVHYFQAWQVKERFWKDGFVFWSHLWFGGYPANYTYPIGAYLWVSLVHWLTFGLMGFSAAYSFGFFLFYAFNACAVFFLGRVAFNRWVGIIAGILFLLDRGAPFSGGWYWMIDVGVWPVGLSVAFSTIATGLFSRLVDKPTRANVGWCGLLIGLALLTHPIQIIYLPILFIVGIVVALITHGFPHVRGTAPSLAAAAGIGILIGAAWYLPFVAMSAYTRSYGQPWISLAEMGANIYKAASFPTSASFVQSEDLITTEAMKLVPLNIDGVAIYTSVLALLSLPLMLVGSRFLPMLLAALTFVIYLVSSTTLHQALGITSWSSYSKIEFPRMVMVLKPFVFVGAAAGLLALWSGIKKFSSTKVTFSKSATLKTYVTIVTAVGLTMTVALPAFIVVLNRHVFQRTILKSQDVNNDGRDELVKWVKDKVAEDPRFFRIAIMGWGKDDHSLTDLGTVLPVPIFHLGFTPAVTFRYNMSSETDTFPPTSDSAEIFTALNVRYVLLRLVPDRTDLTPVRQFGPLGLYEFTQWNPFPYVLSERSSRVEVEKFASHEIILRAEPGAKGTLRLNVSNYPRWSASRDGVSIPIDITSVGVSTGFITVELAPGTYRFVFGWGLAEWLGLSLSVIGWGILGLLAKPWILKKFRRHTT